MTRTRCVSLLATALLILSASFLSCARAVAQPPVPGAPYLDEAKGKEWKEAGGQLVLSGKHVFSTSWRDGGNKMYWKNDEDPKNPATHPWDTEVSKDVVPKMGQITLRGPGNLARFLRRKGSASAWPALPETGSIFVMATLGDHSWVKGSNGEWYWEGRFNEGIPSNPNQGGWINAGDTKTLDIMASTEKGTVGFEYKNYVGYPAGREVEYEFWFFPQKGGGGGVIIGPDDPDEPDDPPFDPDDPYGPGEPDDPNDPYGPGEPDDPNDPYGPGEPDDPGDPDSPPSDPAGLRIRADDCKVRADASVTAPVRLETLEGFPKPIDGRANIANLNLEIGYDPNVVRPVGDVIAGNLLGGAIFQANNTKAGLIKMGFAIKQGIRASGVLAQIPFQAVGQPGLRSPLTVTITTINDDQGGTPAVPTINGSIQIIQEGVPGDINGNGVIDAGDALCALKMSVDLMQEDLILDMDHQDGVTSNDARLLLEIVVQGSTTMPGNTTPGTTGSGTTGSATPTTGAAASPVIQSATSADARRAYQAYIAAYNRMTSLMAAGKGDTPAAKQAYAAYKETKTVYEAAIADQPPMPTE